MAASPLTQLRPVRDAVTNNAEDAFALVAGKRQSRFTHPFRAEPRFLQGQLDVLHKFDVRVELEQRVKPTIECARLVPAASPGQVPESLIFTRKCDSRTCHPAIDAENRRFEREI